MTKTDINIPVEDTTEFRKHVYTSTYQFTRIITIYNEKILHNTISPESMFFLQNEEWYVKGVVYVQYLYCTREFQTRGTKYDNIVNSFADFYDENFL